METLNTLFLVDSEDRLTGTVPLARLFLYEGSTPCGRCCRDADRCAGYGASDRITELFDKYNLLALRLRRGTQAGWVSQRTTSFRPAGEIDMRDANMEPRNVWKRFRYHIAILRGDRAGVHHGPGRHDAGGILTIRRPALSFGYLPL